MASFTVGMSGARGYSLTLNVNQVSQNISANTSTVSWSLVASGSWGSYGNYATGWSVSIGGQGYSGTIGSFNPNPSQVIASGSTTVGHAADGTLNLYSSGWWDSGHSNIGSGNPTGWLTLSTIPRASTASWAVQGTKNIGSTYQINTNRASSGFTHTITYKFGNASGTIATGVGTSVNWAIPIDLLNQIPNATSGNGTITTTTYSGGTNIGSKNSAITLTAPTNIVPDWDSVTVAEANPSVASKVGAYVQGVSKLSYSIAGARGVYGSTISQQRFQTPTQTVDGATGTTAAAIAGSGTVPVTHLIVDSRGRQKSQTTNLTVLPYTAPIVNSYTVERSLSDGTVDVDEGTYLKITLNANVQSLINGTQRNTIGLKVYTKLRGANTWTLSRTLTPTGIVYNSSFVVAGPFAVDQSYDVRVEVIDIFNTSAAQTVIPVAAVFMHWGPGLGVGKFWEQGALDVAGDIYSRGVPVPTQAKGLLEPSYRGPGPAKVKLDGDSTFTGPYDWNTPYIPWASRRVNLTRLGSNSRISGQISYESEAGGHKSVRLNFASGWQTYNSSTAEHVWSEGPTATQLPSGLVVLSGLIRYSNGVPADYSAIADGIPEGMRPEHEVIHFVNNSDTAKAILISPEGVIAVRATGFVSNGYVSLDGISYWPAGTATWNEIGTNGTSFGPAFESHGDTWGTPAYYQDEYGFTWFRGIIKVKTTVSADNTPIFNMPPELLSVHQQHMRTTGVGGYSGLGADAGQGRLQWKMGSVGAVGNWISLAGIMLTTESALTLNDWRPIQGWANSWKRYLTQFPEPAFLRRGDGLCTLKGLVNGGTLGTGRAFWIERELWPHGGRALMDTMAANARARLDISGADEIEGPRNKGGVSLINGSNTWFSLDSVKWVPGI